MSRRYRKNEFDWRESFGGLIGLLVVLFIFYTLLDYLVNRSHFWKVIGVTIIVIFIITATMIFWRRNVDKKFEKLFAVIQSEYGTKIENFINDYGHREKAKGAAFSYRDNHFSQERLKDLQEGILENKITQEDLEIILKRFIEKSERDLTIKHVNATIRNLGELDSHDFEALLKRLYSAMGYSVELTGKTGDQGGDLVLVRGDERVVIQAKEYQHNNTVGNSAVQQVVAAKGIYHCPRAVVITTSSFTSGAKELARVHKVELIDGKRLSDMLVETLKENWV